MLWTRPFVCIGVTVIPMIESVVESFVGSPILAYDCLYNLEYVWE